MTSQLLRIGNRYINLAQVTQITQDSTTVTVTLTSLDCVSTDSDNYRHFAEYVTFDRDEAIALLWWLLTHSEDVMSQYATVVEMVKETSDVAGALED